MKAKIFFIAVTILLTTELQLTAQTNLINDTNKPKTVLLINAHLMVAGRSLGKLNASFYNVARNFFLSNSYRVLETKISDGYNIDEEVQKIMQADIVILQTPINWESTPWIYKKYADEVFTSAMTNQKFHSGDGRSNEDATRQYGTGGKLKGKKFMICATWNAPKESFNDTTQYMFRGKSADDVLFNVAANYRFIGFEILPGYHCYDVFRNQHIKQDLENYPAYIKKILKI